MVKKNIIRKDLIILSTFHTMKVPAHKARLALDRRGGLVQDYAFSTKWDGCVLCTAMETEMQFDKAGQIEKLSMVKRLSMVKTGAL